MAPKGRLTAAAKAWAKDEQARLEKGRAAVVAMRTRQAAERQTGGEQKLSDADANRDAVDKQDRDAAEDRAIQRAEIQQKVDKTIEGHEKKAREHEDKAEGAHPDIRDAHRAAATAHREAANYHDMEDTRAGVKSQAAEAASAAAEKDTEKSVASTDAHHEREARAEAGDPQRDSALSKLAASKEGKAEAAGLAKLYDTMSKPSGYKLDPKVAASNKAQQLAASGEKHAEHKAAVSAHIKAGSDAHDAGDEETANAHMAAEQAHDEAAKLAAKAHKSGTPEDKAKAEEASAKAEKASQATETGSRGGTYYTTESGKKVYVKK